MSYEIHGEEEMQRWEHEHEHRIVWQCPQCNYQYEAERYVNEALECPHCKVRCEQAGESYLG